ncbi:ABC transporter permease [Flavilitoribacter nigricans DSM 23189 = NBRC 102662]|uniref:ABC transporter permease n=2 Tax=Flavilitoribacter TaxID=2762562 RepID=A0A2D0NDV1_FLAN2|nr:ABC transporter permease [Flavilitoribacter nigricans DSM 23189 = NBRC 102662]
MAWRDSRQSRGRLLLFISSIVIGIAALVAIQSFGENLQNDIDAEAQTLLGADLALELNQPPSDSLLEWMNGLGTEQARTVSFVSMAYFPGSDNTRLASIQALEGNFPFYGELVTEPAAAGRNFVGGPSALVDQSMMEQYGAEVGDSVKIGELTFRIAGRLLSAPGRTGINAAIAPVIYIPIDWLDGTGLVQRGSRINYNYFFKFDPEFDIDQLIEDNETMLDAERVDDDTVEDRKRSIGNALGNFTTFLNLVAFVALLLGCIGVASAVHIYIKEKVPTVAVLRCLGASGRQAFQIYLIQVAIMGLLGTLLGVLAGSILQLALPAVMADFLPVENISTDVSWKAVVQGLMTGMGISILFTLLPLLRIRRTSPLRTLRAVGDEKMPADPLRWVIYGLITIFVALFTYWQTESWQDTLVFPLGLGIALGVLALVARAFIWALRRFFPRDWSFVWRQSLANLFRPNNQTLILLVSIGLGTALLATLFFTRDLLLDQVRLTGSGDRPNMVLFDIQTSQKEEVARLVEQNGLPLLQEVPIVTMRLETINGITKAQNEADTTSEIRNWVFNREYRVTYRDTLIDSETVVEGEWHGEKAKDGTIYVSIADNIADDMQAEIGDALVFNVQGRTIETVVSSIREVDFRRVQTNFFVVFPSGVLENAPQFHVVVTRTSDQSQSIAFQSALVQGFPNVSVVDLSMILKTVDEILNKVAFVVRFMALFSILTGLLVLISSVLLSKYQRIRESVLLRTIGAKRRQILWINGLEYFILGSLATITGLFLAVIGAWALAYFQLDIPFRPNLMPALYSYLIITGLTVLIGLFNSREIVSEPPLEVLRRIG